MASAIARSPKCMTTRTRYRYAFAPVPERLASLSFFFPALNEEDHVRAAVADALAILPRFAEDIVVTIVDDGSTDRTGAIADELAAKDARVLVIHHQRRRGYGGAGPPGPAPAAGGGGLFPPRGPPAPPPPPPPPPAGPPRGAALA